MTPEQIAALVLKSVTDAVAPLQATVTKQADELAFWKMSPDERKFCDTEKMDDAGKKAFAAKKPEERTADMKKVLERNSDDPIQKALAPVLKINEDLIATNSAMAKRIESLEGDKSVVTFQKRATDLGLKAEHGEILRKAYSGDATAQTELDKLIKQHSDALATARSTGLIFKEFGSQGQDGTTAYDKIVAKAAELRKADPKLTEAQAFDKAYNDPANADLAAQDKEDGVKKRQAAA